jgi:hypothetical protein
MKIDLPPGASRKDRLAQTPVSKGGARKFMTGTLMVVEIQIVPAVVSSHRSEKKSPPLKESENT